MRFALFGLSYGSGSGSGCFLGGAFYKFLFYGYFNFCITLALASSVYVAKTFSGAKFLTYSNACFYLANTL